MKIQRDHISQNQKIGAQRPSETQKRAAPQLKKLGKDEVQLSPSAKEALRLAELARSLPDSRKAVIDAIKAQIRGETYDVPPRRVAKSIIDLHKALELDDK